MFLRMGKWVSIYNIDFSSKQPFFIISNILQWKINIWKWPFLLQNRFLFIKCSVIIYDRPNEIGWHRLLVHDSWTLGIIIPGKFLLQSKSIFSKAITKTMILSRYCKTDGTKGKRKKQTSEPVIFSWWAARNF